MIHKQVINHRQIAWLVGSVLMTGMMIHFLQGIARVGKMDAWFSQVLPVGYAILVAFAFAELTRAFPGKNLFEILFMVCGKWVGGGINFILLAYVWLILILDIKGASEFLHAALLPRTPLEIILLVFVLLIMYYGRTSLEVVTRVNEIYFPAVVMMLLTLYFLLGNEYSLERLEPILSTSINGILASNLLSIGVYGDIFLFGAFLHASSHPVLTFAAMKHGVMIVGFSVTLLLLILLGVMGYTISSRLNYPIFTLVQQIHVTDFLDRVEIVLLSLWFPAYTIKVIVAYLALLVGIGSYGGQKQYTDYNSPCGWFLVVTALLSFPRIDDLNVFVNYGLSVIVVIVQVPVLLFLYVKARRNRKIDVQISIPEGTRLFRFYRVMVWMGALAMLGCVLTIVIGNFIADKSPLVGMVVAITYIFFYLVALLASYAEMQALNHGKQKLARAKGPGAFRQ